MVTDDHLGARTFTSIIISAKAINTAARSFSVPSVPLSPFTHVVAAPHQLSVALGTAPCVDHA